MITNSASGTNVHEIADGIYRTERPHPILRGGGAGDYFEPGERFDMRRPS